MTLVPSTMMRQTTLLRASHLSGLPTTSLLELDQRGYELSGLPFTRLRPTTSEPARS
jgi:hypothetical protein